MRRYAIKFTTAPDTPEQPVNADEHEIADGYLVLRLHDGTVAGLFALDVVKEWSYVERSESRKVER